VLLFFYGTVDLLVTYFRFRRVPVFRYFHYPLRILGVALFVLLILPATPARASQDVVQFGSAINVSKGDTIHDAVCFFCSVNVQGTVTGDIVAFFGDVRIEGRANHDVVNFFGEVKAADDTSIGHDLVNFFGGVQLGQNVTVGQDLVVMFGSLRAAQCASFMIGGSRVVEPGWLFWGPLLLVIFGISFVISEFRRARRRRMLGY
jgi:hypothetical protein